MFIFFWICGLKGIIKIRLFNQCCFAGGYYYGTDDLGYGVDIQYLRWGGIFQVLLWFFSFLFTCMFSSMCFRWSYNVCIYYFLTDIFGERCLLLQRIVLVYLFVVICEIWLSRKEFILRRLFGIVDAYLWYWLVILQIYVF